MRLKCHARHTSVYSLRTFASPRSSNWRNPNTDGMMPNTGSTVCLRSAPGPGLERVLHLLDPARQLGQSRRFLEAFAPRPMVRVTTDRHQRRDFGGRTGLGIRGAVISGVGQQVARLAINRAESARAPGHPEGGSILAGAGIVPQTASSSHERLQPRIQLPEPVTPTGNPIRCASGAPAFRDGQNHGSPQAHSMATRLFVGAASAAIPIIPRYRNAIHRA